ncbi:ferredoxin--sulfite reductase [Lachnospiraceae bacterium KM106-2]|nr:ferredoxin--sulfite reductase [Lachnospiraceae bacterium KM106-2]
MNINYADQFREDLKEFREITNKFYRNEITVPEYKHFSGGFGSYAQRGGERGMLRLRLCGGRINKDQLNFIADSINKYHIDLMHFTTCQTIQLHNLTAETICELVEEAWDHGIITRGGGGDFPRNVMATPLSGLIKDEYFDVTPYVCASADYLLSFIDKVKLPRKLKVCFSSNPKNIPHATFRDLGFVATKEGKFDVYSAGGLGISPKMGVCVATGIEPNKIFYYIKAMINTFITYGNYEKRSRARTRFMQDTLGSEGYVKAYQEQLKELMDSEDLDITVEPIKITKQGCGEAKPDRRLTEQKQQGLYAVYYHPIGGTPSPSKILALRDAINKMEEVELRLTPNEGIYIVNLNAKEAEEILAITDDGARNLFESSVACIGASICQIGLRDSQALIAMCVEALRPYNFADGVLPLMHISGCPSSCGTHQIGVIGFRGAAKPSPEGPKVAFALFENGCDDQGKEHFGEDVGIMVLEDIPKFLIDLGETVTAANTTFYEWVKTHHDDFLAIAKKYI